MKISKEQVLEIYNCSCHSEPQNLLKKMFPKVFKTELKVGKWYENTNNQSLFCVTEINDTSIAAYGFDWNGVWSDDNDAYWGDINESPYLIPTTDKNLEIALIREAKKRGFKEGVEFKTVELFHGLSKSTVTSIGFNTRINNETYLFSNSATIFYNGKWATIIPQTKQMTVAQVSEMAGCKVEIIE